MKNLFFVTTDPAMALGVASWWKNTWIVTWQRSKLVERLVLQGYKVWCLEDFGMLEVKTPGHLLQSDKVKEFIEKESKGETPKVTVFKNSTKIEQITKLEGYQLLANKVDLVSQIEDKFRLEDFVDSEFLVENFKGRANDLLIKLPDYEKYVIQTNRGWAGSSTQICNSKEEAWDLLKNMADRQIKISKFIDSKTYTLNACITKKRVLTSPLAWQINRPNAEWATRNSTTCGRQWDEDIDENWKNEAVKITEAVGSRLHDLKYLGYFGLDLI